MDLQPFIGSAVVAAIISGLVSLRTTARSINVEHVTHERAKWREKIREKSLQVHQAIATADTSRVAELHLEFALIVNPLDPEDRQILSLIRHVSNETERQRALGEFEDRVTLLLKHDWERVKREAAPAICRICMRVERITYEKLLRLRASQRRA